jgi:hypothetical protein
MHGYGHQLLLVPLYHLYLIRMLHCLIVWQDFISGAICTHKRLIVENIVDWSAKPHSAAWSTPSVDQQTKKFLSFYTFNEIVALKNSDSANWTIKNVSRNFFNYLLCGLNIILVAWNQEQTDKSLNFTALEPKVHLMAMGIWHYRNVW